MTEDELKAIDQRLAAMSERVDAVIAKEKPLGKRMPILDFKPRPAMASNSQQRVKGNYRPLSANYEPLPAIEPMWAYERPRGEDCIEQIFADFERQFDEMAQAHRYRA